MQTFAILLMFLLAAPPQRIETQFPDRSRVTRVETAMNHLTVIELAEPVTLTAAGSPFFKIELRENKVFIQPLEEGASTNLLVWTGTGRWSYELVPAASLATMHFAIDQASPPAPQSQSDVTPSDATAYSGFYRSLAEEMLLFGKPIRSHDVKFAPSTVGVLVTDVYRKDQQLFIRYVMDNRSARPYRSGPPEVFALQSPRSQTSLYTLRYSQLGRDTERKLRSPRRTPIAILDCEVPSEPLPPGETVTGILALQLAITSSEPTVLRFVFPSHEYEPISVTLVL